MGHKHSTVGKNVPKNKPKTNKAARKRLKVTGTGKILYWPAGRKHLMSGKNAKRRRQSRRWQVLTSPADVRKMSKILNQGRLVARPPQEAAPAPAAPPATPTPPPQEKKG
jgi:large subunit ribosomal protein L35